MSETTKPLKKPAPIMMFDDPVAQIMKVNGRYNVVISDVALNRFQAKAMELWLKDATAWLKEQAE